MEAPLAPDTRPQDLLGPDWQTGVEPTPKPVKPKYWLHLLLFALTVVTTTLAGLEWMAPANATRLSEGSLTWAQFSQGFWFSLPFLGILTVHEFGHYFTARAYKAQVTLPYYIPMWLGWLSSFSIGTMGAFIRIGSPFKARYQLFDVGAAGPLAGYVAAVGVLVWGYLTLPSADFIFTIHPEYLPLGPDYAKYVYQNLGAGNLSLGNNLTMQLLAHLADPARLPNSYELMHYPLLFAGFMALFFTALNLFPIGQLDGGHILYGLVGPVWHRRISPLLFLCLVMYSGMGVPQPMLGSGDPAFADNLQWNALYLLFLYITFSRTVPGWRNILMLAVAVFGLQYGLGMYAPLLQGYNGWLVFCLVLGRFLGIYHPPTLQDEPLSPGRKVVGIVALVVFILSFSPQPFVFE